MAHWCSLLHVGRAVHSRVTRVHDKDGNRSRVGRAAQSRGDTCHLSYTEAKSHRSSLGNKSKHSHYWELYQEATHRSSNDGASGRGTTDHNPAHHSTDSRKSRPTARSSAEAGCSTSNPCHRNSNKCLHRNDTEPLGWAVVECDSERVFPEGGKVRGVRI
jgi:hypothetical protein